MKIIYMILQIMMIS